MDGYEKLGKTIHIPIAVIQYDKNCGFHCSLQTIYDANIGFSKKLISAESPNEVMDLVEKEINYLTKIFKSLK